MVQKTAKIQDKATRQIYSLVKKRFPDVPEALDKVVYRYNPASIRLRIIDPAFEGKSYGEREAFVEGLLEQLPPNVRRDITLLLLLTPKEAQNPDLMNLEFDDPTGTRL